MEEIVLKEQQLSEVYETVCECREEAYETLVAQMKTLVQDKSADDITTRSIRESLAESWAALKEAKRRYQLESEQIPNELVTIERMLNGYDSLHQKINFFSRLDRMQAELDYLRADKQARDKRIRRGEIAYRVKDYIVNELRKISTNATIYNLYTFVGSENEHAVTATELLRKIEDAFGSVASYEYASSGIAAERLEDSHQLQEVTRMTRTQIEANLIGNNTDARSMFTLLLSLVDQPLRNHPLTPIR